MSAELRRAATGYLRLRRSLGYQLADHEWLIARFLCHVEELGHRKITVNDALAFAQSSGASRQWQAKRLAVVRGLAAYVHAADPAAAELIPQGLIYAKVRRRAPYLYTQEQVAALVAQAGMLRPPFLAATMSTLVGLMAVTGMRTCEVRRLNVEDLDVDQQVLAVTGKGGKQRLLPLHASTVGILVDYLRLRAGMASMPPAGPLLVGCRGGRLSKNTVAVVFRRIANSTKFPTRPGTTPGRLYDLRHTFAVNSLIDAHRQGVDVDARIAALATYLGHAEPANTYWYLTASPELMTLVMEQMSADTQRPLR